MKFSKSIQNISTKNDLKRFASAYVVDHRNLRDEEIIPSLEKASQQYFFEDNIRIAWHNTRLFKDPGIRILSWCIVTQILLNQDDFMCSCSDLEEEVLKWEKKIIDATNEDALPSKGRYATALEHFQYVVEAAWDHNDDITPDEQNLIDKILHRFNITEREYRIIEATIGKFPKPGNQLHLRSEIDAARKHLQSVGLITIVRDDDGIDYDVIPEEIAFPLRNVLELDIRRHGYEELLKYKAVRKKEYYVECLSKCGYEATGRENNDDLRDVIIERVKASVVLGGTTPRDGLSQEDLVSWCRDLNLQISGTKAEVVSRIISFYDNIREKEQDVEDERVHWFNHYSEFASRNHEYLRGQQLIDKDIEIERKFEEATRYLFETKLGHKPLKLVGSEHADGALSYGESILLWDNKSKETNVNLGDHIRQFDRYISQSDKRIGIFLVIAPAFTENSAAVAMQYFVEKNVIINLITAAELKSLALDWENNSKSSDRGSFPLGFFAQTGRFNRSMVNI